MYFDWAVVSDQFSHISPAVGQGCWGYCRYAVINGTVWLSQSGVRLICPRASPDLQ